MDFSSGFFKSTTRRNTWKSVKKRRKENKELLGLSKKEDIFCRKNLRYKVKTEKKRINKSRKFRTKITQVEMKYIKPKNRRRRKKTINKQKKEPLRCSKKTEYKKVTFIERHLAFLNQKLVELPFLKNRREINTKLKLKNKTKKGKMKYFISHQEQKKFKKMTEKCTPDYLYMQNPFLPTKLFKNQKKKIHLPSGKISVKLQRKKIGKCIKDCRIFSTV